MFYVRQPDSYYTVKQVRQANKAAGQYYFSPATMRFFNSRAGRKVFHGKYFITSEQYDAITPKRYTIRIVHGIRADIDTVGKFQQYSSWKQARRAIEKL